MNKAEDAGRAHNHQGNCHYRAYSCKECGEGNLCDVWHDHCEPRGDCGACDFCEACDHDETSQPHAAAERGDDDGSADQG